MEEEIFGLYNLCSRFSSPQELNRIIKFQGRGPCPPTAHEREVSRQFHKAESLRIADAALSAFNKEKNAEYELVDPSTIVMNEFFTPKGIFSHCSFQACPKNDPSSPVQLLFAESKYLGDAGLLPIRCCSLEL